MAEKVAQEKGLELEIRKYLHKTPSEQELKEGLKMMGMKPMELGRTKEAIGKENPKKKNGLTTK